MLPGPTRQPQTDPEEAEKRRVATTIVDVLNEALQADPQLVRQLCEYRLPCRPALMAHPTIVALETAEKVAVVGMLGILNGICLRLTGKYIAAVTEENGEISKFTTI